MSHEKESNIRGRFLFLGNFTIQNDTTPLFVEVKLLAGQQITMGWQNQFFLHLFSNFMVFPS